MDRKKRPARPSYHRPHNRSYHVASRGGKIRLRVCAAICCLVMAVCLAEIIGYIADYHASRKASAMLRQTYYSEPEPTAPPPTASAAPAATGTPEPLSTPEPVETARVLLPDVPYPENSNARIRSQFQKLRRQNGDIIGWLTIDELLDEAVVQRDNSYYLRRDYRGYHNENGALFLDQYCELSTRPYTLMVYGHNMKTGAMFGCLRNYENISFYKRNPFITFNTAYEDGRYVIFAISTVSTETWSKAYVDFGRLCAGVIDMREEEIKELRRLSMYATEVEVAAEDQLLLLITCVGDDSQRRVVAARRIRPEETETGLANVVKRSSIQP